MDETVLKAYLIRPEDSDEHPVVKVWLPAPVWERLDAVDMLNLKPGEQMTVDAEPLNDFAYLQPHLQGITDLHALNAFAEQVSRLDAGRREIFQAMVQMEENAGRKPELSQLMDLASSTDSCCVTWDAMNDEQLGRFYVENDFLAETEDLTDAQIKMLDFAKIGREQREAEGGVFTPHGYVVRVQEVTSATPRDSPKVPEYSVLLELAIMDTDCTTMLTLPATPGEIDRALERIDAEDWSEVTYRCADCRIPALRDAISEAGSPALANGTARVLADLGHKELVKFKAVLAAKGFSDLNDAMETLERLDEYLLTREYDSYESIARKELDFLLDEADRERLLPHVNLYPYGQAVLQAKNMVLTDYGGVMRRDMEPIQTVSPTTTFPTLQM